ncbi:type II toxin-antitoxin system VapB family antitoxin [Galbitalea sp. SE-J8]|uniref:type II toxin-antitoxin system VapB family antitoxin n=1 Tax=Galbitalea sp. SE-J8 TaxID=3054952 RepID=UPI00259CBAEE|nr:type II toxin-antitoxin system VapB family antitoxin [Galbitalea sp. SE-J8]MDM4761520.1 type II toxin-antitoxin system VapB family antitoxin [Galbitalea sp. SE-J8]
MATNLALDPKLIDEVLALSGARTKKAAVTLALTEFIARRARADIVSTFGTLEWDDSFDYKRDRLSGDHEPHSEP